MLPFTSSMARPRVPTIPENAPSPTASRPLVNPFKPISAALAPVANLTNPTVAGTTASANFPVALSALSSMPVSALDAAGVPPTVAPGLVAPFCM